MRQDSKKVYIILLNWNGWKDTIECLESVFRSQYDHYKVIVCDNGVAAELKGPKVDGIACP